MSTFARALSEESSVRRNLAMKPLLLAGASLLAILTAAPGASAATTAFSYTGTLVDFTVPATGEYEITAFGAQGESAQNASGGSSAGGKGAEISNHFNLTAGEILEITVGGMGGTGKYSGGGGGGSFVIGPGNTPLVIAGGGGGAGGGTATNSHSYGGLIGNDGGDGFGSVIERGAEVGGAAQPAAATAAGAAGAASRPTEPLERSLMVALAVYPVAPAASGTMAVIRVPRATAGSAAGAAAGPAILRAQRSRVHSALEAAAGVAALAAEAAARESSCRLDRIPCMGAAEAGAAHTPTTPVSTLTWRQASELGTVR
jgi:hypothetical protein